uniref:Uncharacterized protein n=1 Tax=Rhizophora mucronata TaxID=61149 RepID=A0A2P2PE01_RHIMU
MQSVVCNLESKLYFSFISTSRLEMHREIEFRIIPILAFKNPQEIHPPTAYMALDVLDT